MTQLPALVDIHNHLMPAVDDGARDLESALLALRQMWDQGVRRVTTTPHVSAEAISTAQGLEGRLAQLDHAWQVLHSAAQWHLPELEVRRGCELMLDLPRAPLDDPRLRIGGGDCVLVEFPRLFLPGAVLHALAGIRNAGWIPVVAHPERYINITLASGNLAAVAEWRKVGARMAVNAGSLLGGFGSAALATVREMLRCGWVDLIGSDYHARGSRPLVLGDCYSRLVSWGGEDQARLLLSINPGRVMDGVAPLAVPPLPMSGGGWSWLRNLLPH